ncbi:MAG: hypothetical protein HS100_17720 [Anaerolineales bacterium]|nr:hypothetical protein [Anaerolineales bacterium]
MGDKLLEREFLERRLPIVEERIKHVSNFEVDKDGRFHLQYQPSPHIEYALIREARLIEKMLVQVEEGKVSNALTSWRKILGEKLLKHREYYRPMQEAYDHWLSLPFPTRIEIPEPPAPPELNIIDSQGSEWIVDEHLLKVIDDVNDRLKKWIESDDDEE